MTTRGMGIAAWFPWLIATAGILAYANSFACPFLFDDAVVITHNPHLYHLWPPWKAVLSPARFLADYSFALSYFFSGYSPADFRLFNILIHLFAGLLLYGIIRRTLLLPLWHDRFIGTADVLAFAIALLWTLHPLQTESVTYIAQRIEALMGLFFLLTLACFINGISYGGSKSWFVAAFFACLLGMGTKEVMVAAPPLILLYDAIFVASSWKEVFQKRWKVHAALFSTWIFLALLMGLAIGRAQAENVSLFTSEAIRWQYALTQLNVLAHYVRLSVIPVPLCLDYYWPLIESPRDIIWPGTLTLLLGAGTVWAIWRRSWLGFMGAWFFIILAPTSSFNPLPDAAFEHRMYLPLAAVLTVMVMGLFWASRSLAQTHAQKTTRIFVTVISLAGLSFGFLTHQRNKDYQSEESMWRDVIKKCPGNVRPYISLSSALLNAERYGEAEILCSNFLSRCPDFSKMQFDVITNEFVRPNTPALPMFYAMIHNNLGLIAINLNRPKEAKQHYREALRIYPTYGEAHRNLGYAFFLENNVDAAIAEWQIIIKNHPRDYKTLEALGVAYSQKCDFEAASTAFESAIKINPELWFSRAQLAWLLATCPEERVRNGEKALNVATPLLSETHKQSSRALDIMAAAYAEAGNYSNAVNCCERAIMLLSSNATPSEAMALQKRKELYRHNRPYRERHVAPLP